MRYFNKAMLVASAALCLNLSVFSQNISKLPKLAY